MSAPGLQYSSNLSPDREGAMGQRRAQSQVQAGLTGLGRGPSLPEAVPAAGHVVWDGERAPYTWVSGFLAQHAAPAV